MNAKADTSPALRDLNEAQAYAVTLGDGPILVIAGAGTGKTRTLVHRVAHLVERGVPAHAILLLTFTRRASAEMLARARGLNPECGSVEGGTFHSIAYRLLRRYGSRVGLPPAFTIIDPADAGLIVRGVLEEGGLKTRGDRRFPKTGTLVSLISKARNLELDLPELIEAGAPQFLPYLEAIEQAAQGFARVKREQGLADYDDLLFMAEDLLKQDKELRQDLGRRWQHLLVDEYQDTNAVQGRLLGLLCSEHQNVMVVGDDAQSIYAFRGARRRNILEFPRQYPKARLVKLEQNYRSTQPILDLTNQVIAQAKEGFAKQLFTEIGSGPRPELVRPRDERGQTRLVVKRIRELMSQGVGVDDIAVLFRSGRDSYDLEVELTSEHLPFVKVGGFKFLEAAHVKDVLSHLRVLANPSDFLSWQRIFMLLPKVGPKSAQQIIAHMVATGDPMEYLERLADAPQAGRIPEIKDLAKLLQGISSQEDMPVAMVERVLEYYEPICTRLFEDYPRRLRDLAELPSLARPYDSALEFMSEVVLEPPNAREEDLDGGRLTLSTIHSSKGLEWPHVFILWLAEGRLPSYAALDDPASLEEERRLLYVAATRARTTLTLLAPREYYSRGQGVLPMALSRFLEDLPAGLWQEPEAGPVFPVPQPASPRPASRGSQRQNRPFAVGAMVNHASFGTGKVMGYKGDDKIYVHFRKFGLKTLVLRLAKLTEAE